jgi:hypothetical protein
MIDTHRQMRYQRTLDIPNHLLRRKLRSRKHMYLIYRTAVTSYDSRRNHSRQGENQLFRTLYRENTTRYRRSHLNPLGVSKPPYVETGNNMREKSLFIKKNQGAGIP